MCSSKQPTRPAFQPTAPQSTWGNNVNYAPMSGYTRAGQGISGVDLAGIQQRIMQDRQRQMQMQQQQQQAPAPQPNARRVQPARGYQVLPQGADNPQPVHTWDGRTRQEIQNVAREAPLQTRTNLTPMQHRILRGKGMWDEK